MTSPFQEALREELLAAARRRQHAARRRHRSWIAAAVAAVAAAIAAAVTVLAPSPATADVVVERRDGRLEVRLTDLTSTASDVRRALAEAGVEAQVDGVPTGPSKAGRFVHIQLVGDETASIAYLSGGEGAATGFAVPESAAGVLVVGIGEQAQAGEPYAESTDAFVPDEPLHCSNLWGETLATAADQIDALDLLALPTGTAEPHVAMPVDEGVLDDFGDWRIAAAHATSVDQVVLEVVDGSPTTPEPSC